MGIFGVNGPVGPRRMHRLAKLFKDEGWDQSWWFLLIITVVFGVLIYAGIGIIIMMLTSRVK